MRDLRPTYFCTHVAFATPVYWLGTRDILFLQSTVWLPILLLGRDPTVLDRLGGWDIVYEIGLVVWIIFGLGYIFMIITVISDGLKRPARKAAKRLKRAEKVMVSRILHEILDMRSKVNINTWIVVHNLEFTNAHYLNVLSSLFIYIVSKLSGRRSEPSQLNTPPAKPNSLRLLLEHRRWGGRQLSRPQEGQINGQSLHQSGFGHFKYSDSRTVRRPERQSWSGAITGDNSLETFNNPFEE